MDGDVHSNRGQLWVVQEHPVTSHPYCALIHGGKGQLWSCSRYNLKNAAIFLVI